MKDLRATRGKRYIRQLISEGEHETQDFKYAITDARKIARSLSAFANHRGGRLLVGVKDNGVIAGIRDEGDIYMIEQAADRYCRPRVSVEFSAYNCGDTLTVLTATVSPVRPRPVCAVEEDGTPVAYVRVGDENIMVPEVMLRAWRYEAEGVRLLAPGGHERDVLRYVAAAEHADVHGIAVACHISHESALDLAGRLAAIGLLDFRHDARGFSLVPAG